MAQFTSPESIVLVSHIFLTKNQNPNESKEKNKTHIHKINWVILVITLYSILNSYSFLIIIIPFSFCYSRFVNKSMVYRNRIYVWCIIMTVWWVGHIYNLYFIWLIWNIHCCHKNWRNVITMEIINITCHISIKKINKILSCVHTIENDYY